VNRLVIFAPNWLGDAVMALPAIADVRRASPGCFIAVAARPVVAPMFSRAALKGCATSGLFRDIDEVIVLERTSAAGWRDPARALEPHRFDAALLLPNSFHSALVASTAGIAERWGYRTDWRGRLLTRAIPRPPAVHQVEYYRRLVSALGFSNGPSEPRLEAGDDIRQRSAAMLTQSGWDGRSPVVVLAPGAAYGGAKRWPPSSFAAVARGLADDGMTIVMVGSSADAPSGREVEEAFGSQGGRGGLLNLIGQTDLPTLAGVLVHGRALITNDSGAMHLAAALGVPVTAVFGPTNERETAPIGRQSVAVLSHPVWCRPCMLRECPLDHRCMRGVPADDVLDAARRMV
jgi:heptosyltransferase-2